MSTSGTLDSSMRDSCRSPGTLFCKVNLMCQCITVLAVCQEIWIGGLQSLFVVFGFG